jgi:CBS domain-containing protein
MAAVCLFLLLSLAILWFVRDRLGITDAAVPIAVLILVILVYGALSGRLSEFSGPGGWGAKFRDFADSEVQINPGTLELTNSEMENIPKTGLAEVEHKLRSITPGKPVVMSLTLGKIGYYDLHALHSALMALMRLPNFRFVLFVAMDGKLVCYTPAASLLGLLNADQNGVIGLAGSAHELITAVNAGDINRLRSYLGMLTTTITTRTSNEQALHTMESMGMDAIVVVDDQDIPIGVAERWAIIGRMLLALAKGAVRK